MPSLHYEFLIPGSLLVGFITWAGLRRHYDLIIRVVSGHATVRGRYNASKKAAIAQFFEDDLAYLRDVTVRGRWRGSRFQLWFRGIPNSGDQQRIRNFLMTTLPPA